MIQRLLGSDPALRSRQRSYRRSLAANGVVKVGGPLVNPAVAKAKKPLLLPGQR